MVMHHVTSTAHVHPIYHLFPLVPFFFHRVHHHLPHLMPSDASSLARLFPRGDANAPYEAVHVEMDDC